MDKKQQIKQWFETNFAIKLEKRDREKVLYRFVDFKDKVLRIKNDYNDLLSLIYFMQNNKKLSTKLNSLFYKIWCSVEIHCVRDNFYYDTKTNLLEKEYINTFDKNVNKFGWVYVAIQLEQLKDILHNLIKKEEKLNWEELENTLMDIAGFCVLSIIYIENYGEVITNSRKNLLTEEEVYEVIDDVVRSLSDDYDVVGNENPYIHIDAPEVFEMWDRNMVEELGNLSDYIRKKLPKNYAKDDIENTVNELIIDLDDQFYDYIKTPLMKKIWSKVENILTVTWSKTDIADCLGNDYIDKFTIGGIIERRIVVDSIEKNIWKYLGSIGFYIPNLKSLINY